MEWVDDSFMEFGEWWSTQKAPCRERGMRETTIHMLATCQLQHSSILAKEKVSTDNNMLD
jgi:hypothetical protein